jgi:hypothetical protein
MLTYLLETHTDLNSLSIFDVETYTSDWERGIPYHTQLNIKVVSRGFSGYSRFTTDNDKLQSFIHELNSVYESLCGNARLQDLDYGSYIELSLDKKGVLLVQGILYDEHREQELRFSFTSDQTALESMVKKMYQDIVVHQLHMI